MIGDAHGRLCDVYYTSMISHVVRLPNPENCESKSDIKISVGTGSKKEGKKDEQSASSKHCSGNPNAILSIVSTVKNIFGICNLFFRCPFIYRHNFPFPSLH